MNEPKEVKFIDFQSARLCSLVTDILTFCFTSMSSTLRREYISQILEVKLNTRLFYIPIFLLHFKSEKEFDKFTLQLYYSTFVVSCHTLNCSRDLFTLEELKQEFRNKVIFGFLEGIWYLDIIYQGQRPEPYVESESPSEVYFSIRKYKKYNISLFKLKDEQKDGNEIPVTPGVDEMKEIEIGYRESIIHEDIDKKGEDIENYRREFFSMLEDVMCLGGETLTDLGWLGIVSD